MIAAALVTEALPWAGFTSLVAAIALLSRLVVKYLIMFTERYAKEVKDQAIEIASLKTEMRLLRTEHTTQMTVERTHRAKCEESLSKQGRLLENLQLQLEGLDRRKSTVENNHHDRTER